MNEGLVIGLPVGDFVLLLCHGVVCIIRIMRDLILPLGKSSIYSTNPEMDADPLTFSTLIFTVALYALVIFGLVKMALRQFR